MLEIQKVIMKCTNKIKHAARKSMTQQQHPTDCTYLGWHYSDISKYLLRGRNLEFP